MKTYDGTVDVITEKDVSDKIADKNKPDGKPDKWYQHWKYKNQ